MASCCTGGRAARSSPGQPRRAITGSGAFTIDFGF